MFLKTIPNHTLEPQVVPTPRDYIAWQPSDELKAWIATQQKLTQNADFAKEQQADPYIREAERVFSGLAPGDSIRIPGLATPLTLQTAAAGIKRFYSQLLDQAWADARARGEKLPPLSQKLIPPSVPGE
jgi:hypothetical protein